MIRSGRSLVALLAGLGLVLGGWAVWRGKPVEAPYEPKLDLREPDLLCPWREPDADLRAWFPAAERTETLTRILSGQRVELAARLGRDPTPDEHIIRIHQAWRGTERLGSILVRRAKGEHGVIELVLAVSTNDCVAGLRLQRHREPPSIAAALLDPEWLGRFRGVRTTDPPLTAATAALPEPARRSGQAIVEGVHALLVLYAQPGVTRAGAAAGHGR